LTINFNKPVTNPVLHISGLGGNIGTNITMYHASLNLTGWTGPSSSVTLSRTAGNTNFTVNSTEIRPTTVNGGTSCTTAPLAGCGSVRVNGTVSSLTSLIHDARFRVRSGHLLRLAVLRGRPASLAFVSPHSD
jgi:hypothetical protein